MSVYIKPYLKSYKSDVLTDIFGPVLTQYTGYLDIGAARRAELIQGKNQIVICKILPEKQTGIIKLS